jgi:hypothetical protein
MIDNVASAFHFKRYPPISIPALMSMIYAADLFLNIFMLIQDRPCLEVIIIAASGYL